MLNEKTEFCKNHHILFNIIKHYKELKSLLKQLKYFINYIIDFFLYAK